MKRLREEKGWTQNQLATELCKAGLDSFKQITVARIEEGKRAVKLEEAGVIAQVLDSHVHYMLTPPQALRYIEHLQRLIARNDDAQGQMIIAISEYLDARASYRKANEVGQPFEETEHRDYLSDEIISSLTQQLNFIATHPTAGFEALLEHALRTTVAVTGEEIGSEFIKELQGIDFQAVLDRAKEPEEISFL